MKKQNTNQPKNNTRKNETDETTTEFKSVKPPTFFSFFTNPIALTITPKNNHITYNITTSQ